MLGVGSRKRDGFYGGGAGMPASVGDARGKYSQISGDFPSALSNKVKPESLTVADSMDD